MKFKEGDRVRNVYVGGGREGEVGTVKHVICRKDSRVIVSVVYDRYDEGLYLWWSSDEEDIQLLVPPPVNNKD